MQNYRNIRAYRWFAISALLAVLVGCDKGEQAHGGEALERTVVGHPDGLYTLEVPTAWGVNPDPRPGPFGTIQFTRSPDVVVSHSTLPPSAEIPIEEQMSMFFMEGEEPAGELVGEKVAKGEAAHRVYNNADDSQRWWIRVVRHGGQNFTITVSDASERFQRHSDLYLEVAQSFDAKGRN